MGSEMCIRDRPSSLSQSSLASLLNPHPHWVFPAYRHLYSSSTCHFWQECSWKCSDIIEFEYLFQGTVFHISEQCSTYLCNVPHICAMFHISDQCSTYLCSIPHICAVFHISVPLCKETILQFPLILWFEPLMVGRAIYKIESRGILKILIFRLVTSEL